MLADVEGGKGRCVGRAGVGIVNVEVTSVDLIKSPCRRVALKRRQAGGDPGRDEGVGGCLDGAVLVVVDGLLVSVGVAKEDVGDDVGGVAVDNLVEEVGVRGEDLAAGPSRGDVAEEPDTLGSVLGGLELVDEEREETRGVGIAAVDVIFRVCNLPEVSIQGNVLELGVFGVVDAVGGVVRLDICCSFVVKPAIALPEGSEMRVVLLLQVAMCAWKRKGGLKALGAAVVIA